MRLPTDKDFFKFVEERHAIWYRRFVLKQPPPWTKDLILARHSFTNVYRELDRGTIWYLENVVPLFRGESAIRHNSTIDAIWYTLTYRLLNNVDTWEAIGGMPGLRDWSEEYCREDFRERLIKLRESMKIYSPAYITLQLGRRVASRITNFVDILDEVWRSLPLILDESLPTTLEDFTTALTQINGIGMFTAYEIACDLLLVPDLLPYSIDDWANLGPGARIGLFLLTGSKRYKVQYEKLLELRDAQPMWRFSPDVQPWKPLNLRNVEHSLCEAGKYWSLCGGKGRRRYFVPKESGWLEKYYDAL